MGATGAGPGGVNLFGAAVVCIGGLMMDEDDTHVAASRARPDVAGVRVVMLGWCLWLLGSWAVTLTLDSPVAAVRWMVFSAFTGLVIVWPAVRLSQGNGPNGGEPRHGAISTVVADWLCLMVIFQAVVWPLSLVARWTWQQALWIDAAMVSWSALAGAVVALARQVESGAARAAGMAVCVLLMLGAPTVRMLLAMSAGRQASGGGEASPEPWAEALEPVAILWRLTDQGFDGYADPVVAPIVTVAAAAVMAWAGVWLVQMLGGQRGK